MELLYAEDLESGAVIDLGHVKVSRQDILGFGKRWDPLPMHTDEKAAAAGPFGGLIASVIHTLAMFQRLQVNGFFARTAIIAGRGMESMHCPHRCVRGRFARRTPDQEHPAA
ncbi:MaoC/PaaZ C-terminal domain-containing protein [Streptomyces mirabilis]|uniref:MaoC/PaaZ C-terminal domain-containing protein n=1 Tax=Streptomyces mirabilis TaxID=68239 RepID=UPI00333231CD